MTQKTNSTQDSNPAKAAISSASFSRRTLAGTFAMAIAALAGSSASAAQSVAKRYRPLARGADSAATDPSFYDPDFPPIHFPHIFKSQGKAIQSFLWLADGSEAKGCVILCPQAFGGDALDSLVPPLVGAGINVMRFNPRGMWDEDQDYSFITALEDLHAAVDFLRSNGGNHQVPVSGRAFAIDTSKIAVLGKSGGGGALGWVAAAENPHLNTVIAVSPASQDMYQPPLSKEQLAYYRAVKESTAGRIDLELWSSKLTPADYRRLSMTGVAPRLVSKNLFLIGSSGRDYIEKTHRPIVKSLEAAGATNFSEVVLEANEYFLTARIALARLVISWLKEECGY